MQIREAILSDASGIAKVHVDSWRTTYKGIIPDEFLNKLSYERREDLWRNNIPKGSVFVAEDAGQIIGFSSGGKERTGKYREFDGELNSVYLLKEYQGKQIGRLLVEPVIAELQKMNLYSMLVLVLKDNSSRYFYEALGARHIDSVEVEIAGKKLSEFVYGWDDTRAIKIK